MVINWPISLTSSTLSCSRQLLNHAASALYSCNLTYLINHFQCYRFLVMLHRHLPTRSPLDRRWPKPSSFLFEETSEILRNMYHKWRVSEYVWMGVSEWVRASGSGGAGERILHLFLPHSVRSCGTITSAIQRRGGSWMKNPEPVCSSKERNHYIPKRMCVPDCMHACSLTTTSLLNLNWTSSV